MKLKVSFPFCDHFLLYMASKLKVAICTPTFFRPDFLRQTWQFIKDQTVLRRDTSLPCQIRWFILDETDGHRKEDDWVEEGEKEEEEKEERGYVFPPFLDDEEEEEEQEDLHISYHVRGCCGQEKEKEEARQKKVLLLGKKRNLLNELAQRWDPDFIVWMDDDDYYPPTRVEHAIRTLQASSPQVDIAGCSELHFLVERPTLAEGKEGKEVSRLVQFGPIGQLHATEATLAYRTRALQYARFDDTDAFAEGKSFLKQYTLPIVQLDPCQTILVLNHKGTGRNATDFSSAPGYQVSPKQLEDWPIATTRETITKTTTKTETKTETIIQGKQKKDWSWQTWWDESVSRPTNPPNAIMETLKNWKMENRYSSELQLNSYRKLVGELKQEIARLHGRLLELQEEKEKDGMKRT